MVPHYKKTFEDVFSSDRPKNSAALKIEEVKVDGMILEEYISFFRDFLTDFYSRLFLDCVKLSWLRRKFCYEGNRTSMPMVKNGPRLNLAFVKVLRRLVGKDIQILTRSKFFSKLEMYFDGFFPKFDEENPFTNPDYYRFPYKNISIEYLIVVNQLDDRLEFLRRAEESKMRFAFFADYMLNHIFCENEVLGYEKYRPILSTCRSFPFYIKDLDKERRLEAKRKKK